MTKREREEVVDALRACADAWRALHARTGTGTVWTPDPDQRDFDLSLAQRCLIDRALNFVWHETTYSLALWEDALEAAALIEEGRAL
jgi:hypothetical protein